MVPQYTVVIDGRIDLTYHIYVLFLNNITHFNMLLFYELRILFYILSSFDVHFCVVKLKNKVTLSFIVQFFVVRYQEDFLSKEITNVEL